MKEADPDFVTHVMRDPRVWECVRQDGFTPDEVGYRPRETYFQFHDRGFVMFRSPARGVQEIHIALLRGARNVEPFIGECLQEMRARGTARFIAPIPAWNRAAIRLAKRCGFVEFRRLENRFIRDGRMYAGILMEKVQ